MNDAILMVAFGARGGAARRGLDAFDRQLRKTFPGTSIQWAYSSDRIRRVLRDSGEYVPSPEEAIEELVREGSDRIVVQSLHVIPGIEFHDVARLVSVQRSKHASTPMAVGLPLLSSLMTLERALRAVLREIPKERRAEDGIILMGHGSPNHPSELSYVAAAALIAELDPRSMLGTLIGNPELQAVIERCHRLSITRAYLLPFMSVAGVHSQRDMAGEQSESWASQLNREGIEPVPVLRGLAETPGVSEIWLDHIREGFSALSEGAQT